MKGTTPKAFRRTAITAAAVVAAVAGAAVAPAASAGEAATASTAGQASATAQAIKVNPTTASLSLGITFGTSLAGYTNQVAQSESRGIDLGIIGTTLGGEGCDGGEPTLATEDQPQPLRADSRDKDASQEKTATESIRSQEIPVITKTVRADATPFSQSQTVIGDITGTKAFLALGPATSKAVTRLVDGTREALATVDIASVGIAGVLELSGLHWEARAQTGKIDNSTGTFTIGSLKVLGQTLPTSDALKAIAQANAVLNPLGIQVVYPTSRVAAGILFVDPLVIRVIPSTARDTISQAVLGLIQPVREQLVDLLLAQDCGNDTYITVADIVLGSLTGAGSFGLELGGANVKSEALKTTSFLGGNRLSTSPSGGGLDTSSGGSSLGNLDSSPSLGVSPSNSTAGNNSGRKTSRTASPVASVTEGSRGGRMALVGLLGLVALALVADRDRRLMRRAQRSIATEA